MNQQQRFSYHNKQNPARCFDGQETNTGAPQIGQLFPLGNQSNFIVQNGKMINSPIPPAVNLSTDYVPQQLATSETSANFQQQAHYEHHWYVEQQQAQANYQEYLRQFSQSAMQQLIPLQVPISIGNGQMANVVMYFPLWSLTGQVPGLVMSSMGPCHQTMAQEGTNNYPNGQIQQFYVPMQQNNIRDQNTVGAQEFEDTKQVEEPLNLVTARAQSSDSVNSQTIFNRELQQMRSSTANVVFMPELGNGLIN